jgi:hypothetical protein
VTRSRSDLLLGIAQVGCSSGWVGGRQGVGVGHLLEWWLLLTCHEGGNRFLALCCQKNAVAIAAASQQLPAAG